MEKEEFIEPGSYGALFFLTEEFPPSIAVFRVLARQVIPFDFGNLGSDIVNTGIDPETTLSECRITKTIQGTEVEDFFYHDDKDTLLHTIMNLWPPIQIMPFWISGYQQSDYHDILTANKDSPFGYKEPPIEFIAIPEVHLGFALRNQYATETINPYIRLLTAVYRVKYIVDAGLIEAVIRKRMKIPWFTIYGYKKWPYDYRDKMAITRPIDITWSRAEIESELEKWKYLGEWTE